MSNIMILNGAGKKNGGTQKLVDAFRAGAESKGNIVTEFQLQNMNIKDCIDCQACRRRENDNPCVQHDDMGEIYKAFFASDIIVFATPIYWWTISGNLKTAVDRLEAVVNCAGMPYFARKKTVFLCSTGYNTELAGPWYDSFHQWMKTTDLGQAVNDVEKAKTLGASIR